MMQICKVQKNEIFSMHCKKMKNKKTVSLVSFKKVFIKL